MTSKRAGNHCCHSLLVFTMGFVEVVWLLLSMILFTVYIDVLLQRLSRLGVGCRCGHFFVSALGYVGELHYRPPSRLLFIFSYMIVKIFHMNLM